MQIYIFLFILAVMLQPKLKMNEDSRALKKIKAKIHSVVNNFMCIFCYFNIRSCNFNILYVFLLELLFVVDEMAMSLPRILV